MAVTRALPAAALLAVALLLGGTAAIKQAPFTLDDLGTGVAGPANCSASSSGTMPTTWAEITEILNFTQYKNVNGADLSLMPDPLPFPYTLSASDTRAPGWVSTCISRSPTAPEDCTGDECNVYIDEWGIQWLEFALLNCYGSYPTIGAVNFFTNPTPPKGNVAMAVTQTCKNYYYGPTSEWDFFYSVTDEWGNKWALQTVHTNDTTEAEFDANVDSVVWPAGFSVEKVALNETVEMVPFLVGSACYAMIMKDSNFNSWHLYEYPEGGLTSNNTLLGAMGKGCERLDAQYTLSGMDAGAAPAPAPAAPTVKTPAASAAAARTPALLLGALVAAAAMLF